MKKLIIIVLTIILVCCQQHADHLIKVEAEELIERIVNDNMPKPEAINIFNEEGKPISIDSLKTLERSGEYFEDFYKDKSNTIQKVVVRKITEEDEKLIRKISQKLSESREVQLIEIDCTKKAEILQRAHERDQGMRKNGNQIDPQIDHENLEIIVSFLEKCGMPTLKEVNEEQLGAIWEVLQHSNNKWRKKYFPLLEAAAEKGDLRMDKIALMKDRILLNEGQPQIYGSQIINGKLGELFEPEYVNQRRAEMGMEPIEDYLARFNVEFKVEQKTK